MNIFRLPKLLRACVAFCCCQGLTVSLFAQQQKIDTARIYPIPEMTVAEAYYTREVGAMAPIQVFSKEELKSLNVLQVSDAVKHFVGVTVKDYGGIGGLKTVSLRSLGTEYTAVGYDGTIISDCQTGQIDTGCFSLDNVDRLSLSNGQSDNIFQLARFFAPAGMLNIQTLTPQFKDNRRANLNASFKMGSRGLVNLSLLIEQKLNRKWVLSVNGEWMPANGHYPFISYYGENNDLSSREKRKNTEMKSLRTEAGLFGSFSDTEQWRLKAYYYQSSRGLPNVTTYYYGYSSQHFWDENVLMQNQYKKKSNRQQVFQTPAKWNWSYQRYLNPGYKGPEGKTENSYHQQEYYLSASALYRVLSNLSSSLSTGGSINQLNANLEDFAHPTRYLWLTAFVGKYVNDWLTASALVLATVINEEVRQGSAAANRWEPSPHVSASFKPFVSKEFYIRLFYRDTFRLPSFNDLYYEQMGSTNPKPESTTQCNLGLTYGRLINELTPYVSVTVDVYYNKVRDKIMAIPTKNLFIRSMVNLGKVDIKGIDVAENISLQPWEKLRVNPSGNYTYQRVLDMTEPGGKTYKQQTVYIPRVSRSGQAGIETPQIDLSYSFLFSGKCYMLGQNLRESRLDSYSDHSVSVSRDQRIRDVNTSLTVEVLNPLDRNYEIVKNFPMPGRLMRVTMKVRC